MNQRTVINIHGEEVCTVGRAGLRRRLRHLETTFPSVANWDVSLFDDRSLMPGREPCVQARVVATSVGGKSFEARAFGADGAAAARLALSAVEMKLRSETEVARHRAADWLLKTKQL
jgi:hypothetical protein